MSVTEQQRDELVERLFASQSGDGGGLDGVPRRHARALPGAASRNGADDRPRAGEARRGSSPGTPGSGSSSRRPQAPCSWSTVPRAEPGAAHRLPHCARRGAHRSREPGFHCAPRRARLWLCASVMPQLVWRLTATAAVFPGRGLRLRHDRGAGRLNRPWLVRSFGSEYLPAIPDVHARLLADPPARGSPTSRAASGGRRSPSPAPTRTCRVDGFDLDRALDRAGSVETRPPPESKSRVTFEVRDAAEPSAIWVEYDLAVVVEAIHDLSRPRWRSSQPSAGCSRQGGTAIIADEKTADDFSAPADAAERLFYGYSITCCLPTAMDDPPSAATGTVMRQDYVRGLREGGGVRRGVGPADRTRLPPLLPARPLACLGDLRKSRRRARARADRRLRAPNAGARARAGCVGARGSGHAQARAHAAHGLVQAAGRVQQAAVLRRSRRRRHRGVGRELRARGRVRCANARPPRRDLRAVQLAEGQGRRDPSARRRGHGRRGVRRRGARREPRASRGERRARASTPTTSPRSWPARARSAPSWPSRSPMATPCSWRSAAAD